MKVSHHAKRRYQLARQARRQCRYMFKPFRHTRATRRALAAMVQRMVDQSGRYALHAQQTRRDEYKVVIYGWPDEVQVTVGVHSLSFWVMQHADFGDCLLWPDCMPRRKHGQWRCFDRGCLTPGPYLRLEDLLFNHLAEPFLSYLAKVPEQAQLMLYNLKGMHHACIEAVKPVKQFNQPAHSAVCWPLP